MIRTQNLNLTPKTAYFGPNKQKQHKNQVKNKRNKEKMKVIWIADQTPKYHLNLIPTLRLTHLDAKNNLKLGNNENKSYSVR